MTRKPNASAASLDSGKTERLSSASINRLLLEYSLPAIIGMTASSLYNIIDRAFIGNGVGAMAISGLAITLPIMNLMAAFGAMIGAGASAMVSIRLGQQRKADATNILGNAFILNLILGGMITVVGLIFIEPILFAFGASETTMPYAKNFIQIILVSNLFNNNFIGLNNIMRASGYPKKAMWSSLLTVGINLCLAPLFIFVFHWGIRGAAFATSIAQICGFIWVMNHFLNKNTFLHFQRGYFRLKKRIIEDILSIGLSPFIINICACLVTIVINKSLSNYGGAEGDIAIGAYGIVNSFVMLFVMVVLGLTMGMQPIAGYNYGAKKNERVLKVYKQSVIVGLIITTTGFLMAMFLPGPIVSLFTGDEDMRRLSVVAMRIIFCCFPFVGFQMVTTNFFQSIGKAKWSIFLSLSRQLIFLLPGLIILPRLFGLNGVWISLPTGDFLATLTTLLVILTQRKRLLPTNPAETNVQRSTSHV
ncbi:MAG: MATE family efflux transporter [Bacteroidota bacterium]|nr:MATE family efflux transporter [Bacteroidota bacterium]